MYAIVIFKVELYCINYNNAVILANMQLCLILYRIKTLHARIIYITSILELYWCM